MVKLIQDLRFFIGLFFALVGALLVMQGLNTPIDIGGINPNLSVGCAYILFGTGALLLAWKSQKKNSDF